MKTTLITTLFTLFIPSFAFSKVHSCILDGGNDRTQRICGSEQYVESVRSVYSTRSNPTYYQEQLISGDGDGTNNGTEWDCQQYVYNPDNLSQRFRVPHNTTLSPANRSSTIAPATRDNATSCFQNATSNDLCHFWSTNHGFYGDSDASIFGRPQSSISIMGGSPYRMSSISATELRDSFNQRNCGTTKYILNNCYSGGMHEILFDDQRNLIPHRCGISSTNYLQPSIKATVIEEGEDPLDRTSPISVNGRDGTFYPPRSSYNFTDSITEAIRSSRDYTGMYQGSGTSLDDAFFIALKNNPMNELPTISSSYYLEDYFNGHQYDSRFRNADATPLQDQYIALSQQCNRQVFGASFERSSVTDLINNISMIMRRTEVGQFGDLTSFASDLNRSEQLEARNDITKLTDQVSRYADFMCSEFWPTECGRLRTSNEKRDFIQRKYQEDYVARRDSLSQLYKELVERRMFNSAQEISNNLHELQESSIFFRRYDFLINRLGQTARFYRSAPADKIRSYLTLRRCETTGFNSRSDRQ